MKKYYYVGALILALGFGAKISQAAAFDIYVDDSNSASGDGSQENPFKTIASALEAAAEKPSDKRQIFIANGTYEENLTLAKSVSLTGESNVDTVIKSSSSKTIEIKETSSLTNLKIQGGDIAVSIDSNAGATITSSRINEAEKVGIQIEAGSTTSPTKVTVKKSKITNGDGKGFYVQKRRISIEDNEISNNEEEGIDIRAGVKGTINDNTISNNGESGIEVIIGKADLKISGNKIKKNSASGISHQFYSSSKKTGSIKVSKNKITGNDNYGLQCATPSGGNVPKNYWIRSISINKNVFSGNDKSFANRCDFKVATK